MTGPLVVLAILSAIGGFIGLPAWLGTNRFFHFLEPSLALALATEAAEHSHAEELIFAGLSIGVALTGIFIAYRLYVLNPAAPVSAQAQGIKKPLAVEDLYRIDHPQTPTLSPDGKRLAYSRRWIDGTSDDALMSAWCMLACTRGLPDGHADALMRALVASGDRLELGRFGPTGDVVTTGAVGDSVPIAAAPMAAALGVGVAQMASRGLGHAGGTAEPTTTSTLEGRRHYLRMEGREVFRIAVKSLVAGCKTALTSAGVEAKDVDWIVPHQANQRILEAVAGRLGVPMERVYVNLERYGNTSSASIPIALDEAVRNGSIKRGQLVLFCACGAGLAWASALVRF